jgi:membrane protease YdiL (CAAX protease family)
VVFSIANGFMEELWFRGSWSSSFRQVLGPSMAMHVTSVVFCVTHVIVYWQEPMSMLLLAPVWLYMGYAYAVIMRRTGSLWGPVLSHAIANVLYMYAFFAPG